MPNPRIPTLVKHMTIAIYREGKIRGKNQKDRFRQCFEIAKSRCVQYGFATVHGPFTMGLTGKGRAAELRHKAEGRSKTVLFDTMYDQFDLEGKKAAFEKKLAEEVAARTVAAGDTAKTEKAAAAKPVPQQQAGPQAPSAQKAPAKPKIKPYSKKDLL
jgi:hypothetical protein